MKPCYKMGQRVKVIPHFNHRHKNLPNNTYHVGDAGVIEEIEEYMYDRDGDHYVYGIRFDHDDEVHYALESMIIPEDYIYTTDNFTKNPKVKRVIGRNNTTLLCVCDDKGADHVFELPFFNY